MKTDVVVQTTALSKVNGNSSLREGSSVFVRVIKNNGNNSYVVAFSGGRFSIKSEVALKEGAGFLARIKLADGKILLQKLDGKSGIEENAVQKLNSEAEKVFLQNLGLVPDEINSALFQQMKNLGVKFNPAVFNKARKIGLGFKGKEKQAAEIAFVMEEKGFSADEETVKAILEEDFADSEIDYSKKIEIIVSKSSFREFFEDILNGVEGQNNPAGVLALFNQSGFKFGTAEKSGSWIKIPFEFDGNGVAGSGVFCGFLRNDTGKLSRATFSFNAGRNNYFFSTPLGPESMNIMQAGCSDEEKIGPLLDALRSTFKKTEIQLIEHKDFTQFMPEQSELEIFRGEA